MRSPRCLTLPAGVLSLLAAALPAFADPWAAPQDKAQEWENQQVSSVVVTGVQRESRGSVQSLSGFSNGVTITREKIDKAYKAIMATNRFGSATIEAVRDPANKGKFIIKINVEEYPLVESVEFKGLTSIPLNQIKPTLRINAGDPYNPFHLMQDKNYIRDQYLSKGYHFSTVEDSTRPGTAGGVILTWTIQEGPMVSVDRIIFTGNLTLDESEIRRYMITKENGRLLFIPTGHEPFVEKIILEDIKRIKLKYQDEGWLDIGVGENVFIEDLVFSDDKTSVTIKIHVDEGQRYKIRGVKFQFDASVQSPQFPISEMTSWLASKPGEPYTVLNAVRDTERIREKYGERAFILAEIVPTPVIAAAAPELDLVFAIKENQKIYIGKINFEGNSKTREEVLRRELTITGFVPGEEYNKHNLDLGIRRLQDRGWVEMPKGIEVRNQETDDPEVRDVLLEIKEGQTGSVRFAAGYSSSFGILGILEFQQRNFDLGNLPASFDDMINGTGFAGGGQFFRIRLAPAARRQSYTVDFKEPYVFGYDFGIGTRAYVINTQRESYNDRRVGASVTVDKRYDPIALQLTLNSYRVNIDSVSGGAPLAVQQLQGTHRVMSLTPAIIIDTRDSIIFPTTGMRSLASYEYAGQILPGDFSFDKLTLENERHFTIYETEGHLKHVISFASTFGLAHGARESEEVPIIERFYAGGRDGPRGFAFRGVGPHENGDPVGGEAFAVGTVEYSYPLFVEFLRGAFFYDVGNLTPKVEDLAHEKWRNVPGFGIRFIIPQLGNIPVKLDFGFPVTRRSEDQRQTVTFDIGALF